MNSAAPTSRDGGFDRQPGPGRPGPGGRFKHAAHAKLEVHRLTLGKPCPQDPHIRAVSDQPLTGLSVPCLDLDDVPAIAAFIVSDLGLAMAGPR